MTRVAAVDCGTNSIRLLICEVQEDGKIRDIVRTMEIVRLGQGVDATGSSLLKLWSVLAWRSKATSSR